MTQLQRNPSNCIANQPFFCYNSAETAGTVQHDASHRDPAFSGIIGSDGTYLPGRRVLSFSRSMPQQKGCVQPLADSNTTKHALAAALKELMEEKPFSKINIADICAKCSMNRKSFYYHFKDKYDLVNWIFDTEFIEDIENGAQNPNAWNFYRDLCNYFYDNRPFYRKALKIRGQNAFSEHFRELCLPIFTHVLETLVDEPDVNDIQLNFFADAFLLSIERWILSKDCMKPDEFVEAMKSCIRIAHKIHVDEL